MSDYKQVKCDECLGAKICAGFGGMKKECVKCCGTGQIPCEKDIEAKVRARLEAEGLGLADTLDEIITEALNVAESDDIAAKRAQIIESIPKRKGGRPKRSEPQLYS